VNIPTYWKTSLEDVDQMYASVQKTTEKRVLCKSAGGRPVYMLAYGPKKTIGKANYSAALGAHDRTCYDDPANDHATVVLIGAVHGQETEGVASLMNLIPLMETGVDLAGNPNDALLALLEKVRLVIVPIANPDGRARVKYPACLGLTIDEHYYWGQGTWKDGSLRTWPGCKRIHPLLEDSDYLGGYYNDDGVNIMHDNFFAPMAAESRAVIELCGEEAADYILHLHGGGNSKGDLLQPAYVPVEVNEAIFELSKRCYDVGMKENLEFTLAPVPEPAQGENPPTFNLVCATHHVCGGVAAVYESNEGIVDSPGIKRTHAEVIRMHMILFEECVRMAIEAKEK